VRARHQLDGHGVLSRGLLSGRVPAADAKDDIRVTRMPRFAKENVEQNLRLVAALRSIAEEKKTTTVALAIAWVNAQGSDIVPLAGSRTRAQLAAALDSLALELTPDDLKRIADAVPAGAVAGTRTGAHGMAELDSER
jgi:aryl-alcohol dehydrogenase-like predicted oxidoreductase